MTKTSSKKAGKRVGRPALSSSGSTQLAVRFPDEMIAGIDEIIEERYGQPGRVDIVRELVAEGLERRRREKGN